jgi:hypothetical protein
MVPSQNISSNSSGDKSRRDLGVYSPVSYIESLWPAGTLAKCPFSDEELAELDSLQEILVYLPGRESMQELCKRFSIRSNIDFRHEHLIRCVMTSEDQWFIAARQPVPELLYMTAHHAKRIYEDEGLYGMDLRRYLAFVGTYQAITGSYPDQQYWTFLLSGSYDRSGVSIVGFDHRGILNHHGWMKNFRAKFVGSRYIVLPPRVDRSAPSLLLKRAYRGRTEPSGLESDVE